MNLEQLKGALIIAAVLVCLLIVLKVLKNYRLKYDHIIELCGGEGSGKTLTGILLAINIYLKQVKRWKARRKWSKFMFWLTEKEKADYIKKKPGIYSNTPGRYWGGKKIGWIYFNKLDPRIFTLEVAIEPGSVLFIDEMGSVIDQYVNYRNNLIRFDVREFFRFFRQYSEGGYLIATDQTPGDNTKPVRDRINVFYFLYNFQKILSIKNLLIYRYRIKSFYRIDNVMNMNTGSTVEENSRYKWGIVTKKFYDTYAYSERYKKLTVFSQEKWTALKTNSIIEVIPHVSPLDDTSDVIAKTLRLKELRKKFGNSVTSSVFSDEDKSDESEVKKTASKKIKKQ